MVFQCGDLLIFLAALFFESGIGIILKSQNVLKLFVVESMTNVLKRQRLLLPIQIRRQ